LGNMSNNRHSPKKGGCIFLPSDALGLSPKRCVFDEKIFCRFSVGDVGYHNLRVLSRY